MSDRLSSIEQIQKENPHPFIDDLILIAAAWSTESNFVDNDHPVETQIPELEDALDRARRNPEAVGRVLDGYCELFTFMLSLTDQDLQIADEANRRLSQQGQAASASHHTLREFLDMMTDNGKQQMYREVSRIFDPGSDLYVPAMTDLTERLSGGHRMYGDGRSVSDSDAGSLQVIWGHTRMSNPEALIHFLVAHYFERYVCAVLRSGRVGMTESGKDVAANIAETKDSVLNAMTEALLLWEVFQGSMASTPSSVPMHQEILDMWRKPRSEGGLEWIPKQQIDAFWQAAAEIVA